jgi:hypothetical protein
VWGTAGARATDKSGVTDMAALWVDMWSLAVEGDGWWSSSNIVKVGFLSGEEGGLNGFELGGE